MPLFSNMPNTQKKTAYKAMAIKKLFLIVQACFCVYLFLLCFLPYLSLCLTICSVFKLIRKTIKRTLIPILNATQYQFTDYLLANEYKTSPD